MRSYVLWLAVAGAILVAGCGSGESGVPETVTVVKTAATPASTSTGPAVDARADRALARHAVLQLSDLPVGWTASTEDKTDAIDCEAFAAVRRMPRGVTPDFAHGDDQFASNAVSVYAEQQDVDAAIDALLAKDARTCLKDELQARFKGSVKEGAQVGEATISELNVEPLGQRSAALRFHVPISAGGVDIDVYADYLFSQVGRGLTMLMVGSAYTEPDEELRATLAQRAVQRLSEALNKA